MRFPRTLPRLAPDGWAPLAHAMVGYLDQLPSWCTDDLRPVMGTSCDFRIHPEPLTHREQLLFTVIMEKNQGHVPPQPLCLANMVGQEVGRPPLRMVLTMTSHPMHMTKK